MKIPTLTEIAKADASFVKYADGELHYRLSWAELVLPPDGCLTTVYDFEFSIPIADAGAGAFLPRMRGIEVLRWARKHADMLRVAQTEVES